MKLLPISEEIHIQSLRININTGKGAEKRVFVDLPAT